MQAAPLQKERLRQPWLQMLNTRAVCGACAAGTIAVFAAWAIDAQVCGRVQLAPDEVLPEGCYHACLVVRDACAAAFQEHRRGMVAGDVIAQLARVMQTTFPVSCS